MILTYKCNNCSKLFNLPFKANDRGELNKKKELFAKCPHCTHKNDLIINQIKAVVSTYINFAYGIALIINIFMFIIFLLFSDIKIKSSNTSWQYYTIALFFLIPFLFAKVAIENELKSVRNFNRYYI